MKLKIILIFVVGVLIVAAQSDNSNLNLPQLQTQNVQLIKAVDRKYTLSLILPNSERTETIYFEPSNGQLFVEGSISTYYPDTVANLIVNYVADKNGYRSSYHFNKILPGTAVSFQPRLSGDSLKSLAG